MFSDGLALYYIDGLVQERRNPLANALELHVYCTNPSICLGIGRRSDAQMPVMYLWDWPLEHWYIMSKTSVFGNLISMNVCCITDQVKVGVHDGFALNGWQAIVCPNENLILWCHHATPGSSGLIWALVRWWVVYGFHSPVAPTFNQPKLPSSVCTPSVAPFTNMN